MREYFIKDKVMNNPFEDIERLRSECSLMDKAAKVMYLRGRLQQLNDMAYRMTLYLRSKDHTTDAERQQAMWLVDAVNMVQNEGQKASRELANDSLREFLKMMLR